MIPVEGHVAGLIVTLGRVGAWAEIAPFVGDRMLPRKARLAAVAGISIALAPLSTGIRFSDIPSMLPLEILGGLMLGMVARLVLGGVEAGGQFVGLQLGLGFAGSFDPAAQESSLPTRRMAYVLAGLAFLWVDGLEVAVTALSLPLANIDLFGSPLATLLEAGLGVFALGVKLSAPLLLAGFVANLTMALASKAAPQLNVFSVMLALFLVVGGTIWIMTAPAFVQTIWEAAQHARDMPYEVLSQ